MMSFTGTVIQMRGKVSLNSYRYSRMLSTVAKARTQNGTHESQSPRRTHLPQGQRCRSLRGHQLSISRRAPCTSELTPQTTPARTYRRAPGQARSELAADVPASNAGYPGNGLVCHRKGPAELPGQLGLLTSRQLLAHLERPASLPLDSLKPQGRWGSPTGLAIASQKGRSENELNDISHRPTRRVRDGHIVRVRASDRMRLLLFPIRERSILWSSPCRPSYRSPAGSNRSDHRAELRPRPRRCLGPTRARPLQGQA